MNSRLTITNGNLTTENWVCVGRTYQDFCDAESYGVLGKTMSLWRMLIPSNERGAVLNSNAAEEKLPQKSEDAKPPPLEFHDFNSPPSARLFNPSLVDGCHADVSTPSPFDFMWSAPGTPPVRVEDMTCTIFRKALAWDLLVCKELAHPFYHRIDQGFDNVILRYLRLLLPVSDRQGRVCRIYAVSRQLTAHETANQERATGWI